jgi:putative tricarboxylic transport membrane protein
MKTLDRASSLCWLLVSVAVCVGSLKMGIGTIHNPGRGFMPFGASGLLGLLSLVLFLKASRGKKEATPIPLAIGEWRRILLVIIALTAYSVFMPTAGYLISTFILMAVLFWTLEKKVGRALLSSLLTTVVTYVVFSKWLNCQFPEGFLGF